MPSDEQIGKNLQRLRGKMSQKELADRMRERGWKWSQATVWSVESGERPLRLAEADDISDILGTGTWVLSAPDRASVVQTWMREMHNATARLKEAIKDYDEVQLNLAVAADDAIGTLTPVQEDGVENWLSRSPLDIVREVGVEVEAEALAERHLERQVVSDERDAELRAKASAAMGKHLRALSDARALAYERDLVSHDGEHSEAP